MRLLFWKKKEEEASQGYVPYEEIDAKRTSKLGYFFLVLMVIFGVLQGNNFLGAIKDSVTRPEPNSTCLGEMAGYAEIEVISPYYYGYDGYTPYTKGGCTWSKREIALSLPDVYKKVSVAQVEIQTLSSKLDDINSHISTLGSQKEIETRNYQASLLEDVAGTESVVFNQESIQSRLRDYEMQIQGLINEKVAGDARIAKLVAELKSTVLPYAPAIQKAYDGYAHDIVVYKFKQFLLSFILIAPLFALVWRYYHKLKNTRSEYTVIWGGAVATVGIIFAQILLVFVYEILPHEIIQQIFAFLSAIKILWALLYWLGFILVPVFFGFLIYLIQKKFYNKKAVMMRALKSNHCPQCSLTINHTMNNCPVCGYSLKTRCTSCGSMSMDGGAFCETCGTKREPQA